jgi:L-serine dehydratase
MEIISVFDMLKIGIGPSSSHTLGPWKAANKFLTSLKIPLQSITCIRIELFGSLSLTGKGHATDVAIVMGLTGEMPEEIEPKKIPLSLAEIKTTGKLKLNFEKEIPFSFEENIIFHKYFLPFHPNGLRFTASTLGEEISETYYSIGGGFICTENENSVQKHLKTIPYPIQNGLELLSYCKSKKISDVVYENELVLNSSEYIDLQVEKIWKTMLECMYLGCTTKGILPGGLNVKRRANEFYTSLNGPENILNLDDWLYKLRNTDVKFRQILKWVSCFALSVNEVNASLGKVVTAPTNGSSGVIPAVLMYYLMIENHQAGFEEIKRFLFVKSEVYSKKELLYRRLWVAVRPKSEFHLPWLLQLCANFKEEHPNKYW